MKDDLVPRSEGSDGSVASSVLERARHGDQEAFKRILVLYSGLVYHWCRSAGLSPQDSEDVGQQVFLTVSKSLHSFARKKAGDSFRAWLRVITRSRMIDHFRENTNREQAKGGTENWNNAAFVAISEEESDAERAVATTTLYDNALNLVRGEFAEQDFRAFHMLVIDGVIPKDVAEELGMTVNSVYIAKSRILKRLRDEFDELLDGEVV